MSPPLSEGGGEEAAPRPAAHSLRLSASFFSLGMPGEEQEGGGVFLSEGLVVLRSRELAVGGALWTSALGSGGPVCGGLGLRKGSLLTEMKALPGVEKGRGP